MKNIKKDFIVILSILTVAFVSCKSNEKPEEKTFIVSSIVGTWTSVIDATYKFTVKDNGEITANFQITNPMPFGGSPIPIEANLEIDGWDADKDKEVKKYEKTSTGKATAKTMPFLSGDITCAFIFNSANSCSMTATISSQLLQEPATIENMPFIK